MSHQHTATARPISTSGRVAGRGEGGELAARPRKGPFSLTVRIYWLTQAALDGTWTLPPIKSVT